MLFVLCGLNKLFLCVLFVVVQETHGFVSLLL